MNNDIEIKLVLEELRELNRDFYNMDHVV